MIQTQRLASLLIAGLLACAASVAVAVAPGEVPIGGVVRDLPMQGLNGPSRMLSTYRGKPLVINVWASWCGPCRREMGSIERLALRHAKQRFEVIGISTDDYPDRAKAFLLHSKATISHFIDQQLMLEHMLGANRLPLTLLIDADGRIIDKIYGATEWDAPAALQRIRTAFRLPN